MRSKRWSLAGVSLAVAVSLAAGCGSDDTVDSSKAESGIENSPLSVRMT
jgi:hypothetical protein